MTVLVTWGDGESGTVFECERVLERRWNGWAIPVMTDAQLSVLAARQLVLHREDPESYCEIFVRSEDGAWGVARPDEDDEVYPLSNDTPECGWVLDHGWAWDEVGDPGTALADEVYRQTGYDLSRESMGQLVGVDPASDPDRVLFDHLVSCIVWRVRCSEKTGYGLPR